MIPRIIHYCWFGKQPFPSLLVTCIDSWRAIMPNYTILKWDESNVPIFNCDFMKEAYEAGKWAFVSDYARYWILYKYGGFFLDCDVEVIKPFDDLCDENLFFAFQDHVKKDICFVAPGLIIGAEKEHPYIREILNYYNSIHFKDELGNLHLEYASPRILTSLLLKDTDLKIENKTQRLSNGIKIFSSDYFDPKNPRAIISEGIHVYCTEL